MMKLKRKSENDVISERDRRTRRQRRRKRARSEPMMDTCSAEKREALRRLFGRICSVEVEDPRITEEDLMDGNSDYGDENDDPLLDTVPEDIIPEQLGFLLCAQEALRFLYGSGIQTQHPMYSRLRSHLLRGMDEISVA